VSEPRHLVVVVGTGTEVGKTWVAAATLARIRDAGAIVAARKPAQSFDPGDPTTDAAELGRATGEDPLQVCPAHRWYEVPLAPPMAADVLGRPPFTLPDLLGEIEWPDDTDLGLVETAGGVRSPLASDDGDSVGLITALMPDLVVLVADAGLGTINAVRLAAEALEPVISGRGELDLVVVLNRFEVSEDLHRRNQAWLRDHDGLDVVDSIDALVESLLLRLA
jgi:dethiobiotin synthetase